MNLLKFIAVIYGCLLLTACNNLKSDAEKAVLSKIAKSKPQITPNSVKFGKFTKIDEEYACLAANVPNYIDGDNKGDLQALLGLYKGEYLVYQFVQISPEACIEEAKKTKIEREKYQAKKAREAIDESDAKKAVLRSLKDPDSAKFGEFMLFGDTHACLTINARNSMGGYTGNQEAYLFKVNGEWQVGAIKEDKSYSTCINTMERSAANALKRQGAGHTGKVLQALKTAERNYIEVESNGEKLWISYSRKGVKVKAGDTVEIPLTQPANGWRVK